MLHGGRVTPDAGLSDVVREGKQLEVRNEWLSEQGIAHARRVESRVEYPLEAVYGVKEVLGEPRGLEDTPRQCVLENRIGGDVGPLASTKEVASIICSVAAGVSRRALLIALDVSALPSCLTAGRGSALRLILIGVSFGASSAVALAVAKGSSAFIAARNSSALATRYSGSTIGLSLFQSFSSSSGLRAPPMKEHVFR